MLKDLVLFFVPDITDTRVIRRARSFINKGFYLITISFRRDRYNKNFKPEWENHHLGFIDDGSYVKRALLLLKYLLILMNGKLYKKNTRVIYAINLDLLIVALIIKKILGSNVPVVYEVADIHPLLVRENFVGRYIRRIEKFCLKYISLLVVTSGAFISEYFEKVQGYSGKTFVLENKVYIKNRKQIFTGSK